MKALKDAFSKTKLLELANTVTTELNSSVNWTHIEQNHNGTVIKVIGKKEGRPDKVLLSAISPDGKQFAVQAHSKLFPPNCYWASA